MSTARLCSCLFIALLASGASATTLTVSAASSLTDAFKELEPVFEAGEQGVDVRFNFAASGALVQQIANGAPVDVFASADQVSMDDAAKRELVDATTRIDFTTNVLVVVVPDDTLTVPESIADLALPGVERIAIGLEASVPAGRYAREAVAVAKLTTQLEPKFVGTQNVRQALDYVARDEADAGFVYATDARTVPDKVRVAFVVPTATPIRYPVAVVSASANRAAAERFVAFLASDEAQKLLEQQGFGQIE